VPSRPKAGTVRESAIARKRRLAAKAGSPTIGMGESNA
jgi:hypothetical protein